VLIHGILAIYNSANPDAFAFIEPILDDFLVSKNCWIFVIAIGLNQASAEAPRA
jgi:hypothetical protein